MKIFNYSRSSLIWLSVLILFLIFLLLPIKIPYSISTPGKIFPAKEWIIAKGTDGSITTILKDNITGISKNYSVSQFDRGDAIQFSIPSSITAGSIINQNDTIGVIYSNGLESQLIKLKGELNVAKASLATYESGEKQSIVQEEKQRLEFMKKQAEEQRKVFKRLESLYKKNLVSQEEYELSKGTTELNDINIAISEAHLQSEQTGTKKEQTDLIKSQIKSLQEQIESMEKRIQNYVLISQITGIANSGLSGDTLLTISDTTQLVIIMPVKWEEKDYLLEDQNIYFKPPDSNVSELAKIIKIDRSVNQINGIQVILVTALLNSNSIKLLPGLILQGKIQCEPVRPLEHVRRMFKSILG